MVAASGDIRGGECSPDVSPENEDPLPGTPGCAAGSRAGEVILKRARAVLPSAPFIPLIIRHLCHIPTHLAPTL